MRARELLSQAREVFERVGMERFLGFADEVERGIAGLGLEEFCDQLGGARGAVVSTGR